MGNIQSVISKRLGKVVALFKNDKPSSLAILGLDAAGKSTLVNLFKDVDIPTVPTLGFNIESVNICNTSIKVWDVGGQKEFISYWCEYVHDIQGLVFVVDIADEERFRASFEGFQTLVCHLKNNLPVLILLNKVDLMGGDSAAVNERIARIQQIYHVEPQSNGMCSYIKLDQKTFKNQIMAVSVRNDLEKMNSPQRNWSIQESSVFSGFKWLIEEMKHSTSMVN